MQLECYSQALEKFQKPIILDAPKTTWDVDNSDMLNVCNLHFFSITKLHWHCLKTYILL